MKVWLHVAKALETVSKLLTDLSVNWESRTQVSSFRSYKKDYLCLLSSEVFDLSVSSLKKMLKNSNFILIFQCTSHKTSFFFFNWNIIPLLVCSVSHICVSEKTERKHLMSQHPLDHQKSKRVPEKNIDFWFIDYAKAFDCVDHSKLWKILKEMGITDHLTCSWESCIQVRKHQLELEMEKQTGSK